MPLKYLTEEELTPTWEQFIEFGERSYITGMSKKQLLETAKIIKKERKEKIALSKFNTDELKLYIRVWIRTG